MRDIEALQEHEASQQRLIEGIVSNLDELTRDDETYITSFKSMVEVMLRGDASLSTDMAAKHVVEVIKAPIDEFTEDPEERAYLESKVMRKLFDRVADYREKPYRHKVAVS
ncbi:MAG TPA: hypothetical protein VFY28_01800 [Candidatus Paceibacterota bacterium]|nr:hypothetical protein [Candidatus Paceibacterota bacterium]